MIWYIIAEIIGLVILYTTTYGYIKTIKGKIKAVKENRHYYMGDDDWTFLPVVLFKYCSCHDYSSGCVVF